MFYDYGEMVPGVIIVNALMKREVPLHRHTIAKYRWLFFFKKKQSTKGSIKFIQFAYLFIDRYRTELQMTLFIEITYGRYRVWTSRRKQVSYFHKLSWKIISSGILQSYKNPSKQGSIFLPIR